MIRLIHRGRSECRQVCLLLDDFISGELSIETSQQILSHLDECPDCKAQKKVREEIRRIVRTAYSSTPLPEGLDDSIRRSVGRYDFFGGKTLRLAAGLIIPFLVAILVLMSVPSLLNSEIVVDHFRAAAADHLHCQGKPIQEADLPLLQVVSEVELVLSIQARSKYEFVEVTECELDGERLLHYKFRGGNTLLSLMVEDRKMNEILPSSLFTRNVSDVKVYSAHQYGVGVASLSTPGHFVYLLAEGLSQQEAASLASQMIPTLKRTLFESS